MPLQFLLDPVLPLKIYTLSFTSVGDSADTEAAREGAHISMSACSNIGGFSCCAVFPDCPDCFYGCAWCFSTTVVRSISSPYISVIVAEILGFQVQILLELGGEGECLCPGCQAKKPQLWSIESAKRFKLCQHPAGPSIQRPELGKQSRLQLQTLEATSRTYVDCSAFSLQPSFRS